MHQHYQEQNNQETMNITDILFDDLGSILAKVLYNVSSPFNLIFSINSFLILSSLFIPVVRPFKNASI